MRFVLTFGIFGLSLSSCSESTLADKGELFDTAMEPDMANSNQRSFRIDVYPSDAFPSLLPQSYQLDGISDYVGLDIELNQTVTLSGVIQGYEVNPTSDILVPGQVQFVEGRVELRQANSIAGNVGYSRPDGTYDLQVPSGEYDLLVSPIFPSNLPFHISESIQVEDNIDFDVEIDAGRPLFGSVQSGEEPLTGAMVQVFDVQTNTPSAQFNLTDEGEFRVRLPDDRNDLRIEVFRLASDAPIPTIIEEVQLNTDSSFLEWSTDIGPLNEVKVSGRLKHPSGGMYQERALIRFKAIELQQNLGELTIETNNDTNGTFRADLLPGRWSVSIIPPFGEDTSVAPTEIELIVDENNDIQMEDVFLNASVRVTGNVVDPQGLPASGVIFSCKEEGFDQHVYSTSTDTEGQFSLELPPSPCLATLTPISGNAAIQSFYFTAPSEDQLIELRLESGKEISGSLLFENAIVPFALIEIRDDENNLLASTLSDNDGRFNLRLDFYE